MTGHPLNPYTPGTDGKPSSFAENGTPILHLTTPLDNTSTNTANDQLLIYDVNGEMDIDPQPKKSPPHPVVGSLSTLYLGMHDLVIVLTRGFEDLNKHMKINEEIRRIKKATVPAALNTAAQQITDAVSEEQSVSTPILGGVVKTKAEKSTKKLQW